MQDQVEPGLNTYSELSTQDFWGQVQEALNSLLLTRRPLDCGGSDVPAHVSKPSSKHGNVLGLPKAYRYQTIPLCHSDSESGSGNVILGHVTLELGRLNHQAPLPEALYP